MRRPYKVMCGMVWGRQTWPCPQVDGPARGGGGGVLGLEGSNCDCGLTAAERWLSQREMAKKRGAVLLLYCRMGELSQSFQLIFQNQITIGGLPLITYASRGMGGGGQASYTFLLRITCKKVWRGSK